MRGWVLTGLVFHLRTKGVVTRGDNCLHTGMMARVFGRSLLRTLTPPQTGTIKEWRGSERCCLNSRCHFLHTSFRNIILSLIFWWNWKLTTVSREWMPTPANVSSIDAKRSSWIEWRHGGPVHSKRVMTGRQNSHFIHSCIRLGCTLHRT